MVPVIPILDATAALLAPVLDTHIWVSRIIIIELLSNYLRISPAELLRRCEHTPTVSKTVNDTTDDMLAPLFNKR